MRRQCKGGIRLQSTEGRGRKSERGRRGLRSKEYGLRSAGGGREVTSRFGRHSANGRDAVAPLPAGGVKGGTGELIRLNRRTIVSLILLWKHPPKKLPHLNMF
jgi:hypothetical protein